MENVIFVGVVLLMVSSYIVNFFADYLNDRAKTSKIPDNVKDVYDGASYQKWLKYSSEQNRLFFIKGTLSFLFVLLMLVNGGFLRLALWTSVGNMYLDTLFFLGSLMLINLLYSLPFKYYYTFSIEERYQFNRSTKKTFIKDQIIGLILTVILGGGIVSLFVLFYQVAGGLFILYTFVALTLIFLLINISYTKIFVPLFNTLTPLEDGSLKQRIEAFAHSQNYEIKKIHTMNASKRSSKLNAFFSGFGKFKNVVLFDTLMEKMSEDEVLAVLAHEIGHAKHKDVLKNIVYTLIMFAVFITLFYGFISVDVFYLAFGLTSLNLGFMLLVFGLILGPIQLLLGILLSYQSRKAEYAADRFAAKYTSKEPMITALKVLSKENFANLTPHPFYVLLNYSHPPIAKRVAAIDAV